MKKVARNIFVVSILLIISGCNQSHDDTTVGSERDFQYVEKKMEEKTYSVSGGAKASIHKVTPGSESTSINILVPEISEGRLKLQVRIPLFGAEVSLINPSKDIVATHGDSAIIVIPRDETPHSNKGDIIIFPEQINPEPGQWEIIINHRPAIGDNLVIVSMTVLERFSLDFFGKETDNYVNKPVTLKILAMDYGEPVSGLSPEIKVYLNNNLDQLLLASEHAQSPAGISVTNEPGVYIAQYIPRHPGEYLFEAESEFQVNGKTVNNKTIRMIARQVMDVDEKQVTLHPLRVIPKLEGSGCFQVVDFFVELDVEKPGTYTTSLFLKGKDGKDIELSESQSKSKPGKITYSIPLSSELAEKKLSYTESYHIHRVDVFRLHNGKIELVGRFYSDKSETGFGSGNFCK